MAERLQKLIAAAGVTSRRKAEEMIAAGRVSVNGKIITDLGSKAEPQDTICIDGILLPQREKLQYLLLYKPAGYITSVADEKGRRTVMDLVPQSARLYPVGRLDYATSGLLLLTNDGALTNALLHPRYEITKCYRAAVRQPVSSVQVDKLRQGVRLEDGMTAPAKCKIIRREANQTVLELEIHEGRNRQVRRMLASLGLDVIWLTRRSFAGLTLEGLKPGEYRALTEVEVLQLRKTAGL